MAALEISQVRNEQDVETARTLFREYEDKMGLDLCFQGFEAELAALPGNYAEPAGRLLIASVEDAVAGCIALKRVDDETCEMKRLYVREEFRGQRIGIALIELLIAEAREIGYKRLRLDTFPPIMSKAVELYRSYGFREIPPYTTDPHPDLLFMELAL
ncbi:MAG TPA: GNAT family N-acetyltransferase [Pyrinomonadaceae bacterium]|nr:GNAT family N-acetyltransferase [Pyrinomonadaceae bacterium]